MIDSITSRFIKHIFGDNYDLGLDYIQILLTIPKQKLPILILEGKIAGKTTFCEWINFFNPSSSLTIIERDFLKERQEETHAIVTIEEFFKEETIEILKSKSLDNEYIIESRGKDSVSIENNTRFILCTNECIDGVAMPFWVLKTPTVQDADPMILQKLLSEKKSFLRFLENRKLKTQRQSRLYFPLTTFCHDQT